jgi:hypothetical protein
MVPHGGCFVSAEGDAAVGVIGHPDVAQAVESKVMKALCPDDIGVIAVEVLLGEALKGEGVRAGLVIEERRARGGGG